MEQNSKSSKAAEISDKTACIWEKLEKLLERCKMFPV